MAIKTATDATFEAEVLQNDKPVVVDFWAAWCGPCKLVAPEMEKLAAKYEGAIDIVKVDVDANPGLSRAFNIMSIPTIAFFAPGKQPMGVVGFRPAEQLEVQFGLAGYPKVAAAAADAASDAARQRERRRLDPSLLQRRRARPAQGGLFEFPGERMRRKPGSLGSAGNRPGDPERSLVEGLAGHATKVMDAHRPEADAGRQAVADRANRRLRQQELAPCAAAMIRAAPWTASRRSRARSGSAGRRGCRPGRARWRRPARSRRAALGGCRWPPPGHPRRA